ncbi:unnamed protein product [Miscanthus lutarioriparius]|uniref:Transcription initiation factor IIF subunit alpha n=1 Tax=Miscanthus lutarioriparius TaxID=422564 RepID=A0A811S9L4_9POAL|nr:unnamed protein product [Miscanthus lutarioriparius]
MVCAAVGAPWAADFFGFVLQLQHCRVPYWVNVDTNLINFSIQNKFVTKENQELSSIFIEVYSYTDKHYSKRPWILEDETGEHQYQGQTEDPPATYYSLTLKGKDMIAVQVGSWYNFSKIAQYKQLTLEEAEEKMNRRRSASGYERWMM